MAKPISAAKVLSIADLNDVITRLEEAGFPYDQWNHLGFAIGIVQTELDSIKAKYENPKDCLRDSLALWLQQKYDTDKYDLPTMKSLADAVRKMRLRVGGVSSRILLKDGETGKPIDIREEGINPMATMKEILKNETATVDINLLVLGRTGQGKSTFVNSIIELGDKIAEEGAGTETCSVISQLYVYPNIVPGITVKIIDTPGLQDIHGREQIYIKQMKNDCKEVSLVLYCLNMTERRLTNDDKVAIQKLHQAFGPKFWKRVVFVLTFANNERCEQKDDRDNDETAPSGSYNEDKEAWNELLKNRFIGRVEHRKSSVISFIAKVIDIKEDFVCLPAGTYQPNVFDEVPMKLPDRDNWLSDLLKNCYHQIKIEHRYSKLRLDNKIHLAVIIDNRAEFIIEEDGTRKSSKEATDLKEAFEVLGFCVLYFYNLSFQSIAILLRSIQDDVDHSQLSMLFLVFLSKGKTPELYDANKTIIPFEDVLFQNNSHCDLPNIPKIFVFDLACNNEDKSQLALPSISQKSLIILAIMHNHQHSIISKIIAKDSSHTSIQKCFEDNCKKFGVKYKMWQDSTSSNFYIDSSINREDMFLKNQVEVLHSMWFPIRCQTIDAVIRNRDEVMSIVRNEKFAKIAASTASVAIGGSLVVAGIVLSPFTFGGSIAVSVAGGFIGGLASMGSLSAFIISKIKVSKHLKTAQEQISLDQQLSISINDIICKYTQKPTISKGGIAAEVAAKGLADVSKVAGAGIAIAAESIFEGGALAFRAGGRVAGMALVGVSLAVTVPVDLGVIIYHSYQIHQLSKDKSGRNDSIQWLSDQTEEVLKGLCCVIAVNEHSAEAGTLAIFDSPECGYRIEIPHTKHSISIKVRTIFSGPFVFPEGFTLVSAVYDIKMPDKELKQDIYIELEHCVNVCDKPVIAEKMWFAIATVNLKKKVLEFDPKIAVVYMRNDHVSITWNKSVMLCVLYKEPKQDTLMKYAAHYSYTTEYRNFWSLSISFTKYLSTHFKYVQSERQDQFLFKKCDDQQLQLNLDKMPHTAEDAIRVGGWEISPCNDANPIILTKEEIDSIEIQVETYKSLKMKFPSINLHVYVRNEDTAADELIKAFKIEGTDLKIVVNCSKAKALSTNF